MTRIVVNPSDLRDTANLVRQVAADIEDIGRLATADLPSMPSSAVSYVSACLNSSNAQLRQTSRTLLIESTGLDRRAALADEQNAGGIMALLAHLRPGRSGFGGLAAWLGSSFLGRNLNGGRIGPPVGSIFGGQVRRTKVVNWVQAQTHWRQLYGDVQSAFSLTHAGMFFSKTLPSASSRRPFGTKITFGALDALTAVWDGAKLGGHIASRDFHDAAWDTGHVAADVLLTRNLYVAAFETGYTVGTFYATSTPAAYALGSFEGSIERSAVAAQFGGKNPEQLTTQEAAKYAHRYDGLGGFMNFAYDSAGARAAGFLRRAL